MAGVAAGRLDGRACVPIHATSAGALPLAFHVCASLVVCIHPLRAERRVRAARCCAWRARQTLLGPAAGLRPLLTWALLYTFEWQVLLYWGMVAAHHALRASRELQRREVSEARLEARLVEAQLESLQRQLNPHFFFNTLNASRGSCIAIRDGAESMLVRLGDLLRAVFRSQVQQEVPLARELDAARAVPGHPARALRRDSLRSAFDIARGRRATCSCRCCCCSRSPRTPSSTGSRGRADGRHRAA